MKRGWIKALVVLTVVILLLTGLLLTVTKWLPRLAVLWLPENTALVLNGNLRWQQGALRLPGLHYRIGNCVLVTVSNAALSRHRSRWQLSADTLLIDSACAAKIPPSDSRQDPRTLAEWQQMLPAADMSIGQLVVAPWQNGSGRLQLHIDARRQRLEYRAKKLTLQAELNGQQLALNHVAWQATGIAQPVILNGTLNLPANPGGLPESGGLRGNITLDGVPDPILIDLNWQQRNGTLIARSENHAIPLLTLPWQIAPQLIEIRQGQWNWPWGGQPLSGNIALSAKNWQQGLAATQITGRLNLLTQGRGGKGNVVLGIGPGRLDLSDSYLPLRLTGDAKMAQLQFFAGLPGVLRGPLIDPLLELQPGALLRMKGQLLSTLEVDEARWPLAGLSVSSAGINGRLQAILSAHNREMGRFRLHLDGRASRFWPDKGEWLWRYWGNGYLAPLAAKWDVNGRGRWLNTLIELNSLSTGFNHLRYADTSVDAPRLTLDKPILWQRDPARPSFNGQLNMKAKKVRLKSGGFLPPSVLTFAVKGRDPAWFLYNGSLQAGEIGPVQVQGRWNGERLRGQMWWPQQSLRVFQPLLSPDLKMSIQDGQLKAQIAFSAAGDQGLKAGGHWLVTNGSVLMPDNAISGIDFSLPFRLQAQRWYFGMHGPVALRIKEISNQFVMQNITADVQGWYPWSSAKPLRLSNVGTDVLGGQLHMANLQMPQTQPATVQIKHINMSELISALKLKQIAMSGTIDGALPLWLTHSQWLVKGGRVANSGTLTVRMDKAMADAISSNNVAAGAALDWMRYMEISRSWATVDIDNLGWMSMAAKIEGSSRFSNRNQRVSLHYTQRENLFQLWRSLRFGNNLQYWVEENATLPLHKEKSDESPD
ncbi:hypothetical protein EJP617_29630 [Erwinia sp. Ejp617]|nr:YdbH family protein [Erwinia sp. Ejp617]ADP12644.1 hypothetical protein EJP617_29630 [Erwinia sp. Ejp617]